MCFQSPIRFGRKLRQPFVKEKSRVGQIKATNGHTKSGHRREWRRPLSGWSMLGNHVPAEQAAQVGQSSFGSGYDVCCGRFKRDPDDLAGLSRPPDVG